MKKTKKSVWPALEAKFVELEDAVARCKFTKARRLADTIGMNISLATTGVRDLSIDEENVFRLRLNASRVLIPARAPKGPTKRQRDTSFKQRMMTESKSDFYTAK